MRSALCTVYHNHVSNLYATLGRIIISPLMFTSCFIYRHHIHLALISAIWALSVATIFITRVKDKCSHISTELWLEDWARGQFLIGWDLFLIWLDLLLINQFLIWLDVPWVHPEYWLKSRISHKCSNSVYKIHLGQKRCMAKRHRI